ncbi:hypothetical protein MTO96_003937 [Rhipicephalus appendiculatus]
MGSKCARSPLLGEVPFWVLGEGGTDRLQGLLAFSAPDKCAPGKWCLGRQRYHLLLARDWHSLFCIKLAKLVWGVPAARVPHSQWLRKHVFSLLRRTAPSDNSSALWASALAYPLSEENARKRFSGGRVEATMGTISDKDRRITVASTSAASGLLLGGAGIVATLTAPIALPVAVGMVIAAAGTSAATITVEALPGDDE